MKKKSSLEEDLRSAYERIKKTANGRACSLRMGIISWGKGDVFEIYIGQRVGEDDALFVQGRTIPQAFKALRAKMKERKLGLDEEKALSGRV